MMVEKAGFFDVFCALCQLADKKGQNHSDTSVAALKDNREAKASYTAYSQPLFCIHVAHNVVQVDIAGSLGAIPKPWRPRS